MLGHFEETTNAKTLMSLSLGSETEPRLNQDARIGTSSELNEFLCLLPYREQKLIINQNKYGACKLARYRQAQTSVLVNQKAA